MSHVGIFTFIIGDIVRIYRNDVKVRVSATSKGVVRTMCLGLTLTTDLYLLTLQVLAKSTRGDPHHLTCP